MLKLQGEAGKRPGMHRSRPPAFAGCQELDNGLDRRRAPFEAPLREAPQDEAFFLNALNTVPSC
jgi:hypothetical protein